MNKKLVSLDELSIYNGKIKKEIRKDTYKLVDLSEYSASSTYVVGDYVYYNELIYKCTTAISVTEVWTAAHWTQKTYLEYMRDALSIPATGVSDSTNSDIDDLFNEKKEVSK